MPWYELVAYVLILATIAFIVGFLVVCLPNIVRNWPQKRYHYNSPASTKYKSNARTNMTEDGSAVDHDKAVDAFKTEE